GKLNLADKKLFDQQLKGYTELAKQYGVEIPKGLENGIKHGAGGVSESARIMLDDLIKTVESKMQIQSPSKVMIALGLMIASGLAIGIKQGAVDVSSASKFLTNTIAKIASTISLGNQFHPPIPVLQSLMTQYLGLGKDLVTNLFTAVTSSIHQSTLSGYASLGQVMRNAVNAALFSVADTLKQPLYQSLLAHTRDIVPTFLRFLPKTLQLVPMLKPLVPLVGGLALTFGNSIIKNLLNNEV
ncbi:MAG: hypothetical protein ACKPCP_38775, partial [Sphaerospermopsis kisseleviana]